MVNTKKKRKIKYKSILLIMFIFIFIVINFIYIMNRKITNIYVEGNTYLTDQHIIDMANLHNYGRIITFNGNRVKKRLLKSQYISNVKVRRNKLGNIVTIKVIENKPILYYDYSSKTLLADGTEINNSINSPILINQVPKDKLKKLLSKLNELNKDTYSRISEIKYIPTEVDEDLFYFTMNDGNYIYINFYTFNKLNNYVDILKSFNNKKGIIHLDSGDYLEIE